MKENMKFQLDVCEQKDVTLPIQAHDLSGFLPQAPGRGGWGWDSEA